mmetsp:Transcript_93024/g.279050  ORF Transcript_93024/g.279050 Transcript_93024/m.279050 type:complete len:85 (-) Transcript_93024:1234-1488(-)
MAGRAARIVLLVFATVALTPHLNLGSPINRRSPSPHPMIPPRDPVCADPGAHSSPVGASSAGAAAVLGAGGAPVKPTRSSTKVL